MTSMWSKFKIIQQGGANARSEGVEERRRNSITKKIEKLKNGINSKKQSKVNNGARSVCVLSLHHREKEKGENIRFL